MEERRRTWFDDRGLTGAGGGRIAVRAGALHYWRAPADRWPALIAAVKALGCTAIDSPVPWAIHERDGGFDWTGARDLPAFLTMIADAGLHAILRPGPWVDAQLPFGGLPERIVREPDIVARAAHGGPAWLPHPTRAYPLPSLASSRYRTEVATWLTEVARVLEPLRGPAGPVAALALDHHGAAAYRAGAFDLDYHPDAIAWWRADDEREPPTRWVDDDADRCVAWVRWKERYLARGLGELRRTLTATGLGDLAVFHAATPETPWHTDLPAIARAIGGPVAIEVSGGSGDLDAIRQRQLWASGSAAVAGVVAIGCGHAPYLPPRTGAEQRAAAITALAAGARGLTITMAVGRDRWIGGALDERGRVTADGAWVAPLLAALATLGWDGLQRRARVALSASRADARHGLASSVLDPAPPIVAELLGLGAGGSAALGRDADAVTYRRWFAAAAAALDLARVPYAIVDESAGLDRLQAFDAIVAPTLRRVDRKLWRDLAAAAAARKVVVYGPDQPTLDELGRPLADDAALPRRAGRMRPGSVDDVAGLAEDLAALVEPATWSTERPAGLHVDIFDDAAGEPRAAIVTNPGAGAVRARLAMPAGVALRDALTGERIDGHDGLATIALAAGDARLFEVVAARAADQKTPASAGERSTMTPAPEITAVARGLPAQKK